MCREDATDRRALGAIGVRGVLGETLSDLGEDFCPRLIDTSQAVDVFGVEFDMGDEFSEEPVEPR